MLISGVETIQLREFSNLLFVQLHTDAGLIGLGETYFGAHEVATYLHDNVAPRLIGRDPYAIDGLRTGLRSYLGTRGTGVEMRGLSAVDIALWDLLGKSLDQPIYQLMGGASRDAVRVYNTCAGYAYTRTPAARGLLDFGLPGQGKATAPYEDLDKWMCGGAAELAESLLEQGITGMKMWPFDASAYTSGGTYISAADLDRGLEPFRQVRRAVGTRMDLMVELHGLWNLPTAVRIARAFQTEGLQPMWIEDPLRPDDITSLARFAQSTQLPTTASELLGGRQAFRELLEARAASVVMLDLGWCGGLSEGKAIASMAEAFGLPIAPHDCTGPVVWASGVHLSVNAPNTLIQEVVRAFFTGWYPEVVTGLPHVDAGFVRPSSRPGHGIELQPNVTTRSDAIVRRTMAADL